MTDSSATLSIHRASPATAAEALRLVFSRFPEPQGSQHVELYGHAIEAGEVSPEGLLEARRGPWLVGALLFQVQPGRTAVLWPPRLVDQEPTATADQLLAAACRWLAGTGVRLASSLLEEVSSPETDWLRAAGFVHLADLVYLASSAETWPSQPPAGPLEFEPYGLENHGRFLAAIGATYRQSLDCPALDGVREIEDVLAGYRATGEFSSDRWFLARHASRDVGCLLLTDHPQEENWELVYMGIVPEVRGRGWGAHVVRHAQWLVRQTQRRRLVLAVDASNGPALAMYAAAGFHVWERRTVYVRVLS